MSATPSRQEIDDRWRALNRQCDECRGWLVNGPDSPCRYCDVPGEKEELYGQMVILRAQDMRQMARRRRDRRQSKPNMIYARGIAR